MCMFVCVCVCMIVLPPSLFLLRGGKMQVLSSKYKLTKQALQIGNQPKSLGPQRKYPKLFISME